MQVVPGFNPLAPIGEGIAGGLARGLEQGIDRGRLQQGLGIAQQLMQNPATASPGQIYLQLAQAFAGVPGGMQALSEVYPTLIAEQRRHAGVGVRPGRGGYQPRGGQAPGQNGMMGGQPQNTIPPGAPAAYAGGEQPMQQPQPQGMGQPNAGGQQELFQPQANAPQAYTPGTGMVTERSDIPNRFGPVKPELNTITADQLNENFDYMVGEGLATPEQAYQHNDQLIKNVNQENEGKLRSWELEQAEAKAARNISQEQANLIDSNLEKLKWTDPFDRMLATQEFYRASNAIDAKTKKPKYNNDDERWQAAYRRMVPIVNAENNLTTGVGRPWDWENYEDGAKAATKAADAFMSLAGAYGPDGQINPLIRDRAIDHLVSNDWTQDEARQFVVPLSDSVNDVVRKAPRVYAVDIPPGWQGLARGRQAIREKNPEKLQEKYTQIAQGLMKTMGPNDSLLVTRRKLYNNTGMDKADFNKILEIMEGSGWIPSEYQKSEEGRLQEELTLTIGEILKGVGLRKYFREPTQLR